MKYQWLAMRHLNIINIALQLVEENLLPFGGVSVMAIGDLLQLPPVKQLGVFMNAMKGTYKALCGSLWWDMFKLHELVEIVWQSSDPEFAQTLNRIHEDKQTDMMWYKSKLYFLLDQWVFQVIMSTEWGIHC